MSRTCRFLTARRTFRSEHGLRNRHGHLSREHWWNSISNLRKLASHRTDEDIVVWEGLQSGTFPNGECAGYLRV